MFKCLNGELVEITPEEEAENQAKKQFNRDNPKPPKKKDTDKLQDKLIELGVMTEQDRV